MLRPLLFTATTMLVVAALLPAGALAAAPTNDTIAGAPPIALGFSEELDTTEATTDAEDAAANAGCGAPATDASVWYSFTAAADGGAIVDVSDSGYSAGVIVATGTPGALTLETCGPGTVGFDTTAGTTYYILAFDDQLDGGGNGGTLRITLQDAPPPPTISVDVNPYGTVNGKTGVATISGTYTCTDAEFIFVDSRLQQRLGVRATVLGFSGLFIEGATTCTGEPQPWTADVYPDGGKFAGGKSASFTFGFACGSWTCSESYNEQTVKLRGVR